MMSETESEKIRRRLLSRLVFMRMDLEAIERLEIEDKLIRSRVGEIREKIEALWGGLKRDNNLEDEIQ